MNIAFTGHRDKQVDAAELVNIMTRYPGAVWVHGGAKGFDSQVAEFASRNRIEQVIIRPNYSIGRNAPLIRNRKIVDMGDILVACYDGRNSGGTYYTVNYAHKISKPVHVLRPI